MFDELNTNKINMIGAYKKCKMATEIQDRCQFQAFLCITPHNLCTIEPRMVNLVPIPRFACMRALSSLLLSSTSE